MSGDLVCNAESNSSLKRNSLNTAGLLIAMRICLALHVTKLLGQRSIWRITWQTNTQKKSLCSVISKLTTRHAAIIPLRRVIWKHTKREFTWRLQFWININLPVPLVISKLTQSSTWRDTMYPAKGWENQSQTWVCATNVVKCLLTRRH